MKNFPSSELMFLLLLVSLTTVLSQSVEIFKSTLLYVQTLSRHGDRAPVMLFSFDNGTENDWPEGLGKLTKLGKKQTYSVGNFLRFKYQGFVTTNPAKVQVNSSKENRCLRSAECLIAAFYRPENRWKFEDDVSWQPIPVNYLPEDQDNYLDNSRNCPRSSQELERVQKSRKVQGIFRKHKATCHYISNKIGINICKGLTAVYLNDTLYAEKIHNFPVPDWAWKYEKELSEIANDLYHSTFSSYVNLRLRTGPLLEKIIENMGRKINGSSPDSKVQVFLSHDVNLSGVLNALNFRDMPQPPYAATLIFELHKMPGNTHTVRIQYLNSTMPEKDIGEVHTLLLNGCSEFCPLEYFEKKVQRFIPKNWENECKIKQKN